MAETYSNLTIVFKDDSTASLFEKGFNHLFQEDYKEADHYFKNIGIKTGFKKSSPSVELVNRQGSSLNIQSLMDRFNVFSKAFLSKIPNATAILLEEYDDYDYVTKTSVYLGGERASKKELIERLNSLDPSLAFLISTSICPKKSPVYFSKLSSPMLEINGVPAFWHLAALFNSKTDPRKLFPKNKINTKSRDGESLMHYIIKQYGNKDFPLGKAIDFLVENDHEIDVVDNMGVTPLMAVCACSRDWPMKTLLKAGANPLKQDSEGKQAIHHACKNNNMEYVVKGLKKAGADLNAVSKEGSALWIANKQCRYGAREAFSDSAAEVIAGENSYCGNPLNDLITAIEHNDTKEYRNFISSLEADEKTIDRLIGLACSYQDGAAFFEIIDRFKNRPYASQIHNDKYFINHLSFLYSAHPGVGDSLDIGLALIKNDSKEGISKLIASRDFIINLERLIRWSPNHAVEFFTIMSNKGADIGSIDFSSLLGLLHRLARDLEDQKKEKKKKGGRPFVTAEDIFVCLTKLKELGLIIDGTAISELKESGIEEERLKQLYARDDEGKSLRKELEAESIKTDEISAANTSSLTSVPDTIKEAASLHVDVKSAEEIEEAIEDISATCKQADLFDENNLEAYCNLLEKISDKIIALEAHIKYPSKAYKDINNRIAELHTGLKENPQSEQTINTLCITYKKLIKFIRMRNSFNELACKFNDACYMTCLITDLINKEGEASLTDDIAASSDINQWRINHLGPASNRRSDSWFGLA